MIYQTLESGVKSNALTPFDCREGSTVADNQNMIVHTSLVRPSTTGGVRGTTTTI